MRASIEEYKAVEEAAMKFNVLLIDAKLPDSYHTHKYRKIIHILKIYSVYPGLEQLSLSFL